MDDLLQNLKKCLGTIMVLYYKTHAFHFNVEGSDFPQYHEFFDSQYKKIWKSVDDFGEHIRQLDAFTPSTLSRMIELSVIDEQPLVPGPHDMIEELYHDQDKIIEQLTKTFNLASKSNKQGLANFLADRLEYHVKIRWMLRSTSKS